MSEENNPENDPQPLLSEWRDHLPEDIASDKSLESFDSIDKLAKAYIDTKADVGRSIRIPGPDADDSTIDTFNAKLMEAVPGLMRVPNPDDADSLNQVFDKLGRPKEATEYAIPEGIPDSEVGTNFKKQLEGMRELAHENGLTKTQWEKQATKLIENFNNQLNEMEGATYDEQERLRSEWGSATDSKFKSILDLAQQTDAPESLREGIINRTLDADTMKWLDSMVSALSDGPQMRFQGMQDKHRITPNEAEAQINEIMAREEYWDPTSPQQKTLLDKVIELQKVVESAA